jgi:hypothetical protein
MKKMLLAIPFLALAGVFIGWSFIVESPSYGAGVTWVRESEYVSDSVGYIRHIYPDPSRYRMGEADGVSQVHFSVFVYGVKGMKKIDLFIQRRGGRWLVVKAVSDGKNVMAK